MTAAQRKYDKAKAEFARLSDELAQAGRRLDVALAELIAARRL